MEKKKRFAEFFKIDRKEAVETAGLMGAGYLAMTTVPDAPWYVWFLMSMGGLPVARLGFLFLIELPWAIVQGARGIPPSKEGGGDGG